MRDSKGIKKIVTLVVLVVAIMVVAVVALAHDHGPFKPSKPVARWDVEFTSIAEGEKTGLASSRYMPEHTATHAWFYVDFVAPGDSIVYDMQVSNRGTLDAELEDIDVLTEFYNNAIKYEIIGIKEGTKIKAGQSKNFKVKISYVLHANYAAEFDKPISIFLTFEQDD